MVQRRERQGKGQDQLQLDHAYPKLVPILEVGLDSEYVSIFRTGDAGRNS